MEGKKEVRQAGSRASPLLSAAKQAEHAAKPWWCGSPGEGEAGLAVVCHWVELKFITREATEEKKDSFKNSAEA